MIQPAAAPEQKRAIASCGSVVTSPHSATSTQASAHISATILYLPKRSVIGPMMSWTEPCASE